MRILFATCTLAIVSAMLSGCMPFAIAYPKVSHFPAMDLHAPTEQVHAYIVETDDIENMNRGPFGPTRQELIPLPISDESQFDSHTDVSVKAWAGWLMVCARGYGFERSLELRIYRPGFELVVVEPWDDVSAIPWKKATSLALQERALDELLAGDRWHPFSVLGPVEHFNSQDPNRRWISTFSADLQEIYGHISWHNFREDLSPAQRSEVLFLADEYTRLATMQAELDLREPVLTDPASPPSTVPEENRRAMVDRLREKARWLRVRVNDPSALRELQAPAA